MKVEQTRTWGQTGQTQKPSALQQGWVNAWPKRRGFKLVSLLRLSIQKWSRPPLFLGEDNDLQRVICLRFRFWITLRPWAVISREGFSPAVHLAIPTAGPRHRHAVAEGPVGSCPSFWIVSFISKYQIQTSVFCWLNYQEVLKVQHFQFMT